jgi:hypothetical protein
VSIPGGASSFGVALGGAECDLCAGAREGRSSGSRWSAPRLLDDMLVSV